MSTFDTPSPIQVTIEVGIADIRIVAGDRTTTAVDIQPADPLRKASLQMVEQINTVFADNRLFIKGPKTFWHNIGMRKGGSVRILVEVPSGSDVTVLSEMGGCACEGQLGSCSVHCGMGTVQVSNARMLRVNAGFGDVSAGAIDGDVRINAASGTVSIGDVGGTATVKGGNGAIAIGSVGGPAQVRSGNGSVEIGNAPSAASVKVASGSIKVGGILKGASELKTSSGDIEIGLSRKTRAWLDIHTFYGTVRNLAEAVSAAEGATEEARINARTSYGDITVTRP